MRKAMTRREARKILTDASVDLKMDYHTLRSSQVEKVLAVARLYGYRKSPSAPGSKARMFFEMLQKGSK